MTIRWYGLLAPEEVPTGDGRMFAAQSLTYRQFPLRAAWQRTSGQGHAGAVVVGSWNGAYQGTGGVWGAGEFLDPVKVPEVLEAVYLLEKHLIGPSVDLDPRPLAYEIVEHPDDPDDVAMKVTQARVNGVTFVMAPAFPQVHITVDNEAEMSVLASAGITSATFAVNSKSWTKFPLAPRETRFDADTAIQNIAAWSGGDAAKFGSAFLWKDDNGNPLNRETYRLPIVDIFDGKAYLVPRAVFSAGVIMSGGHGGLYDTLSESDRIKVQEVLTDIYDMLRQEYADPRVVAPWQRGGRQGATSADAEPSRTASLETPMIDEELDAYLESRMRTLLAAAVELPEPVQAGRLLDADMATEGVVSLTAAGILAPHSSLFDDPKFTGYTGLQVTTDGKVFGHLAPWGQCHLGVGNKCTMLPRSATGYAYFKQGSVHTSDGKQLRVGKITIGTGHADERFGVIPAREHYDNTGACVAVVNAGEDAFGVWVAGALVHGVDEAQAAELRRSPLSGDWRRVNGNLELIGALAVNYPGFPILHEDADGQYSLVAGGHFEPDGGVVQPELAGVAPDDHPVGFQAVDDFLSQMSRVERAAAIGQAFHDLLPPQEGCGCNV